MFHRFFCRIKSLIFLNFLRQHGLGRKIWCRITNIKGVLISIFRSQHKVNKLIGCFFIFDRFGDDNIVKPKIAGFCRHDIAQVFIGLQHLTGLTRKGHTNSCIVLNHVSLHLISHNSLDIWRQSVELIDSLLQLISIFGVKTMTIRVQTNSHDFAGSVNHHDGVLVFRTPEVIPMLWSFINHFFIVDNTQRSPKIRNRVLISWIERLV